LITPDGELNGGPCIGPPGIRVSDVGGEKLDEPFGGVMIRREQSRKFQGARFGL